MTKQEFTAMRSLYRNAISRGRCDSPVVKEMDNFLRSKGMVFDDAINPFASGTCCYLFLPAGKRLGCQGKTWRA